MQARRILGVALTLLLACGDDASEDGDAGSPTDAGPDAKDATEASTDADALPDADASLNDATALDDAMAAEDASASDELGQRMQGVEVGDLVFETRMAGPSDGEPVILLHGFPQTSREWLAQIDALSEAGYRVVAPNQRGYSPGARPEPVEDYTVAKLALDVLDLADALGIDRFHLVGHDWGASVAWWVAARAPERLYSLSPISVPHPDAFRNVLNDPTSCQPAASSYFDTFVAPTAEDTLLRNDAAFLRAVYGTLPQDTIDFYLDFFTSDPAALTGGLNWYRANILNRTPTAPDAGPISVPTMFIWSDGDTALCRDGAVITGDYVDGPYRFEIIEGINHWVPEMAPERVNELLLEHLAEHAADN